MQQDATNQATQTHPGERQEVSRPDTLLAELTSGRLAQRIADAARLAWAKHLADSANALQSQSEAESSGY